MRNERKSPEKLPVLNPGCTAKDLTSCYVSRKYNKSSEVLFSLVLGLLESHTVDHA